jgi:hypothetical protein
MTESVLIREVRERICQAENQELVMVVQSTGGGTLGDPLFSRLADPFHEPVRWHRTGRFGQHLNPDYPKE